MLETLQTCAVFLDFSGSSTKFELSGLLDNWAVRHRHDWRSEQLRYSCSEKKLEGYFAFNRVSTEFREPSITLQPSDPSSTRLV